ncbi:hypothetical protein ACF958_002766 [Providencia rettgeri]|uniref:hypothetical protein n=1 Tax=Providencia TaxID=586 RepID=UPI00206A7306|nr:hypothetical protein [Providencia rettgeri]UPS62427.1 hypothetical protein M0M83_17695 [Providencia rettgeri]
MPIDPSWFKYIPEFVLAAPRFLRRLIQNEYSDWFDNALWGIDRPNLPRELSTFSDDIAASARRAHHYLTDIAVSQQPLQYVAWRRDRAIINIYSRNSLPFHATTRHHLLHDHYEDLDQALVNQYFGSEALALQSVNDLQDQLSQLPLLTPDIYNVAWWTQGYSGTMVFRGALTLVNDNNRFGAIYNFGNLAGQYIINEGDVVINTDFMSTSAHPSVAAEFVIRQALPYPGDGEFVPQIIVDAIYRRVFFRINMRTGRNICVWTNIQQAEILFPLRTLFNVVSIEVGTYGLLVELRELTTTEINNLTKTPKNIMTGHDVEYP